MHIKYYTHMNIWLHIKEWFLFPLNLYLLTKYNSETNQSHFSPLCPQLNEDF